MLKDLATRLATTLGYTVLPKWRLAQLPMAERLRKIFAANRIDTVIDVSANKGQYRTPAPPCGLPRFDRFV
jgi:hypothetical protein